jgi:hypothetical protein
MGLDLIRQHFDDIGQYMFDIKSDLDPSVALNGL